MRKAVGRESHFVCELPVSAHDTHTHTNSHTKTRTKTINMRAREPHFLEVCALSPRVPDPPQNRARLLAHASRQAAATGVRRRTRERRRARRRAARAPPLDITPRLRRGAAARARGRAACAAAARRRAPSWRSCRPRPRARCSTRRPCASARGPG